MEQTLFFGDLMDNNEKIKVKNSWSLNIHTNHRQNNRKREEHMYDLWRAAQQNINPLLSQNSIPNTGTTSTSQPNEAKTLDNETTMKSSNGAHSTIETDDSKNSVNNDEDDEFQDIEDAIENPQEEEEVNKTENSDEKQTATIAPVQQKMEIEELKERLKNQGDICKELRHQLVIREKQLEKLNNELVSCRTENLKLTRLNDDLRMEAKEASNQLEQLQKEFSERLAKEERKVMQLIKEKKELKEKTQTDTLADYKRQIEELEKKLEATVEQEEKKQQLLKQQIEELQKTLELTVEQAEKKQEELQKALEITVEQAEKKQELQRKEIDALLKRCNKADLKNEDMVTTIPDMTIPLLQQIEALEKSAISKESQWKDLEHKLNQKLKIAENNLKLSHIEQQKLQRAIAEQTSINDGLQKQIASLNEQLLNARTIFANTKQQMINELEMLRPLQQENSQLKLEQEQLQHSLREARLEIETLYERLEKFKTEKSSHSQIDNDSTISPPVTNEELPTTLNHPTVVDTDAATSFIVIHRLENDLRKQNTKIQSLLKRVEELEDTKNKLSDELVSYIKKDRKLSKQISSLQKLKDDYDELKKQYDAAIELIGEKEEIIDDLQQDLKYVKEKFRNQITSLLEENDLLKKKCSS
jgi:predicted  nucleic acid-binding Zn-ribbon protein